VDEERAWAISRRRSNAVRVLVVGLLLAVGGGIVWFTQIDFQPSRAGAFMLARAKRLPTGDDRDGSDAPMDA
jgi:hypothetical protein